MGKNEKIMAFLNTILRKATFFSFVLVTIVTIFICSGICSFDTEVKAAENNNVKKIAKFVKENGKLEKDSGNSWYELNISDYFPDNNTAILYYSDETNTFEIYHGIDEDANGVVNVETILVYHLNDNKYQKVELIYETKYRETIANLYKDNKGRLYKYYWRFDSRDYDYLNDSLRNNNERVWDNTIKQLVKYFKKEANIKFDLVSSLSDYTEIYEEFNGSYKEPKVTKNSVDTIKTYNVHTDGLNLGDKNIYYFKKDLNGDGKKETVSLTATKKSEIYGSGVLCEIKIEDEAIWTGSDPQEWDLNLKPLDLNPKDKYCEVVICSTDETGYEYYTVFRYNGKKTKKMLEAEGFRILKQKENYYLQVSSQQYVPGFGGIAVDLDYNKKGVRKNRTYDVSDGSNSYKYKFTKSVQLYSKPDGKEETGKTKSNDTGVVTKVKIDSKGVIAYVFVKLSNGKSGWIKTKNLGSEYIVSNWLAYFP